MKYCILTICFICFISLFSQAQSKKDATPAADSRGTATYDANAENSIFSNSKKSAAKSKTAGKTTGDLKREYYARMEANAKKYEKMAKDMEKPQYSDPSYFGHKHKPKKNPVGKKKFCKECRIRH
ncbi:hypothetical protein [Rhodocytophaga rosea]|uniref:hypothetical protein n=1 Tax=Rhodocytophaga rosea TaxID=2704465 RepID=UPI0018D98E40|nr:hypothetical protein [Rhodocytophaga rosea]